MTDAWHLAEIKGFEQVLAAPGIALLRVVARYPHRTLRTGRRPILLSDDGRIVNRYEPLPSPRDPKGTLRAAYSVPAGFVTPDTVFSLQLDDGVVLSLPAPVEGAARPLRTGHVSLSTEVPPQEAEATRAARSGPPPPRPADDLAPAAEPHDREADDDPDDLEDDAAETSGWVDEGASAAERRSDVMSRVVELSAAIAVAEREVREQRDAREAAEAALESLREESEQRVQAARDETEDRIARARTEAEQDLVRTRTELAELRDEETALRAELAETPHRVRAEVEAEFAQAMSDLQARAEQATAGERRAREREAAAHEEAERAREMRTGFERRIEGLEVSLAEHGDQIVGLEAQLAEATRVRDELGREVTSLRKECARLERELHDALDSVRKMAVERDELGRQAAAFDQVAIKARERATEAEEAHQRSQAVLDELQTWRGELERRLASMSSELGEAKARLAEDDRELGRLRGELAEAQARAELAQAQILALEDRTAGGGGEATVIDRAELERMTGELAALRAEGARAEQALDAAAAMQLREVQAEREALVRRVQELTGGLEEAERRAELAQEAAVAPGAAPEHSSERQPGLATAGAGASSGPEAPTGPDLSTRSDDERAAIAQLAARAEAEAEAIATRELTQALLGPR